MCNTLKRGKSWEVSCEPTILHNIVNHPHCITLVKQQCIAMHCAEKEPSHREGELWNNHGTKQGTVSYVFTAPLVSSWLSETKTQILFWNGHRGFIISEVEKAHCNALRKISSWVESPFLQCALFAAYHHIHNHLHHSQLSLSKRVETPLVLRNQFRKGTEGGLSPGWVESPFAQSLLEFVSSYTISSSKGLLTQWLSDKV